MYANISGSKKLIRKSKTRFEYYMFLAFIWAQELVNFTLASLRKWVFKKLTWTILTISLVVVQVIFLKPDFLSDAGIESTCSYAQNKAENM